MTVIKKQSQSSWRSFLQEFVPYLQMKMLQSDLWLQLEEFLKK